MKHERHSFSLDDSVTLLEEEEGTLFQTMEPETTREQTPLLGTEQDGQKTPPHRVYDDNDDGDPVSENTCETNLVSQSGEERTHLCPFCLVDNAAIGSD